MIKVKKMRRGIGAFISSDKGQRFFNFAYSIGAAIVIWGALFKILHLPGGNALLSLGMGTEVLMFILTAFDTPPSTYEWEKVFPALSNDSDDETANAFPAVATAGAPAAAAPATAPAPAPAPAANLGEAADNYTDEVNDMVSELRSLKQSTAQLNNVNETLLESYRAITDNSQQINASSTGYVEQMAALNRNISGLNTIYEIQLKSISSQLDAIERVNRGIKDIRDMYEKSAAQSVKYCEETEKMARYMAQLNQVYEKMITAMTINMYNPGVMPSQPNPQNPNS